MSEEIRVRLPRKLAVSNGQLRESGRLHPVGPLAITLNLLPLHRVTMTLAESDLPLAMHDLVEVYNQNGSVGVYRVKHIGDTKRKERQIELAHGLDTLSDAHIAVIENYKGDVEGMLRKILAAQKQPIGGVIPWVLGVCEDPNPWTKEIKYDNALECLMDIAKTEEDYMFTFDMSGFPWVLNHVRRDSTVMSEWRMNRNVDQCQISWDDGDQCTRLYLSVTDEDSETITDKDDNDHTIITTREGYYTYDDAEGQNDWGIIEKPAGVDRAQVPNANALAAWVAGYFDRHRQPALQIQIDGQEYSRITGESLDEAHMGRIARVTMPEYEAVFNERLVSVVYPDALRKPTLIRGSLANKRQTSEGSFAEIRQKASRASSGASSARAKAQNAAAAAEKQKIVYDLKVEQDNRHFAIIASEEWYEQMESDELTLVGSFNSRFQTTAREISTAVTATGLVWDATLNNGEGGYVVNPNASSSSLYKQLAGSIELSTQAVGLVWDETANEGAGGWVPSASPAAGSVAARLALIPGQISAAATAVENNISARGYITAEAATNAAKAVIGASLLDTNTGKLSVAEIVAAVNNSGSSVVINADHVDVNGILTATKLNTSDGYAGTLYAQEFKGSTLTASTLKLASSGNTYDTVTRKAVRVGNTLLANLTLLGTGSDTALDIPNAYTAIKVVSDGNNGYKLQGKTVTNDSWADIPNTSFSRATTLSGAWSGDVYTITASPQGNTFTATLAKGTASTAPTIATPVTLTMNNPAVANSETTKTLTVSVQYPGISSSNSSVQNVTQLPASATSSYTVYPYVNVDGTVYYSGGIAIDTSLVYQAGQGAGAGAVTLTMADEEAVYLSGVSASVNVTASKDGGTTTQGHTVRVTNLAIDTSTYANGVYTLKPSFTMGGDDHTKTINWDTSTLDISAKLTAATTDGKNSAKVTGPTWATTPASGITGNSNTATFTTDADTPVSGAAKSLALYLSQGSWSNNKKYVYAHHTSSTDGNRIARIEVDASTLVSNAENAVTVGAPYCIDGVVAAGTTRTTIKMKAAASNGNVSTSEASLFLDASTFSVSGASHRCLNVNLGGVTIGRYDTQSIYNDGAASVTHNVSASLVSGTSGNTAETSLGTITAGSTMYVLVSCSGGGGDKYYPVTAGSGSGGYGTFNGFIDNDHSISDNEYVPYTGGTISSTKTIYAVIENSSGNLVKGPSITVSPPSSSHTVSTTFVNASGIPEGATVQDANTLSPNTQYCIRASCGGSYAYHKFKTPATAEAHTNNTTLYETTSSVYVYYMGGYVPYSSVYQDRAVYYTTAFTGNKKVYW